MRRKTDARSIDNNATIRQNTLYENVWIPLLELFATSDDVFSEPDAFAPKQIHHSLGRLYRSWLDTREALDPDFDRERYRFDMKKSASPKKGTTPLGRKRPAKERRTSSTGRTLTSAKNPSVNAASGKSAARKSAKGVRSDRNASGGQSKTQSRLGYGAVWLIVSGSVSESGSRTKAFGKFRSGTD